MAENTDKALWSLPEVIRRDWTGREEEIESITLVTAPGGKGSCYIDTYGNKYCKYILIDGSWEWEEYGRR